MKKYASYFIKLIFAVGLLAYLVIKGDLNFALLKNVLTPYYIIVGLLFTNLALVFNNFRWHSLLKNQNIDISFHEGMQLTLMGIFFNFALPSSIGGDVVKGYYLAKDNKDKRIKAVTTIMMDRYIGLVIMLLIASLALLANWDKVQQNSDLTKTAYSTFLFFLILVSFIIIGFSEYLLKIINASFISKYLPEKVSKLIEAIHSYKHHPSTIFKAIVFSFASQGFTIAFMVVMASAFTTEYLGISVFLFAVPIGFIVMSLPVAPAGLGIGQLAFLTLFEIFLGFKTEAGAMIITCFQIFLFMWGLVGCYYFLKRKKTTVVPV